MARTPARRALASVVTEPWAILPEWHAQLTGVAARVEASTDPLTAEAVRVEIRAALAGLNGERAERAALEIVRGEPLGDGLRSTVRDGVANIPITGPLYHYANELHDVCGCASYESLARELGAAVNASDVHHIVPVIDSPGGELAGCSELADLISATRAVKPVTAFVTDLGCSAAYWLASAAGEVVIARTARVGSIGVVSTYRGKRGGSTGTIEIVSSQSPRKRLDVETDEGRAAAQATVDELAAVFVESVARQRSVSVDKVLAEFGQGDVFVGARAVAAGLADRTGTLEGLLAELAARRPSAGKKPGGTPAGGGITLHSSREEPMSDTTTPPAVTTAAGALTVDTVKTQHPAIAEALRTEGANAERDRILAIHAAAANAPGNADVALAHMQDFAKGAGDFAVAVLANEAGARRGHLAAMAAEEATVSGLTHAPGPDVPEKPKQGPAADGGMQAADDGVALGVKLGIFHSKGGTR